MRSSGAIHCWGSNSHGQATAPSGTYTAVSAGHEHTCALTSAGTVVCCGDNTYGQAPASAIMP